VAAVRIDTGPIESGHRIGEVPREKWALLADARRSFVRTQIPYDCRELLRFIDEATPEWLEHFGYETVDAYLSRGLELDPDMVRWAVEGLKKLKPEEAVGFHAAAALGKHGEHGRGRPKDRDGNTSSKHQNDSDYVTARLARDNPELAEQVLAGELSAHAAAITAGFRRRTVQVDASEPERAVRQLLRLGRDYARQLGALLLDATEESNQ
jgi:hypothetical protein